MGRYSEESNRRWWDSYNRTMLRGETVPKGYLPLRAAIQKLGFREGVATALASQRAWPVLKVGSLLFANPETVEAWLKENPGIAYRLRKG